MAFGFVPLGFGSRVGADRAESRVAFKSAILFMVKVRPLFPSRFTKLHGCSQGQIS